MPEGDRESILSALFIHTIAGIPGKSHLRSLSALSMKQPRNTETYMKMNVLRMNVSSKKPKSIYTKNQYFFPSFINTPN